MPKKLPLHERFMPSGDRHRLDDVVCIDRKGRIFVVEVAKLVIDDRKEMGRHARYLYLGYELVTGKDVATFDPRVLPRVEVKDTLTRTIRDKIDAERLRMRVYKFFSKHFHLLSVRRLTPTDTDRRIHSIFVDWDTGNAKITSYGELHNFWVGTRMKHGNPVALFGVG